MDLDNNDAGVGDLDEYERWKTFEPRAERGSDAAKSPIKYWLELRDRYPHLAQLAIDVMSVPASSCDCERMFSELSDLLEPRRQGISPELLAAIQCVRRWQKAGYGTARASDHVVTDLQLEELYALCEWVHDDI
jgi:hypothetical protein